MHSLVVHMNLCYGSVLMRCSFLSESFAIELAQTDCENSVDFKPSSFEWFVSHDNLSGHFRDEYDHYFFYSHYIIFKIKLATIIKSANTKT